MAGSFFKLTAQNKNGSTITLVFTNAEAAMETSMELERRGYQVLEYPTTGFENYSSADEAVHVAELFLGA